MKTRKDFRVGDKVFSFTHGSGTVTSVMIDELIHYSVRVRFADEQEENYTRSGKAYEKSNFQALFHGEFPSIPNSWLEVEDKPRLEDLKIDDKVMVRSNSRSTWKRRRFAGIHPDGRILVFGGGSDSWSSVGIPSASWNEWRLPTDEESK